MSQLSYIVIFSILFFIAVAFGLQWYMQFCLRTMLQKKHEWLDFIVATSCVPPDWSRGNIAKIGRRGGIGGQELERFNKKAAAAYRRKLKKLIGYVRVATMMESEDARQQVLKCLREAGERWDEGLGMHETVEDFR